MVPSTLFETGGCACVRVCVCVCVCVCMCDGGKGRPEFYCFLESGVLSLPRRKSDFEGSAQAHFQRSGLVIALTKRGGNFFYPRWTSNISSQT